MSDERSLAAVLDSLDWVESQIKWSGQPSDNDAAAVQAADAAVALSADIRRLRVLWQQPDPRRPSWAYPDPGPCHAR